MSNNGNMSNSPATSDSKLSDESVESGGRSYRYERKFLIENSRLQSVEGAVHLHPAAFFRIYRPRIINNLYLDTPCLSSYRNAVDGIANRLKARIRWYGDPGSPDGPPRLEIKGKEGYVSYKSVFPLNGFQWPRRLNTASISRLVDRAELPGEIRNYLAYTRPVLVNRYRRKYWRTPDGRYRLTLDHNICFSGSAAIEYQNLPQPADDTSVILEVKYDLAADSSFADIANQFPFRQTRSSKYVAGMDRIYRLGNY